MTTGAVPMAYTVSLSWGGQHRHPLLQFPGGNRSGRAEEASPRVRALDALMNATSTLGGRLLSRRRGRVADQHPSCT